MRELEISGSVFCKRPFMARTRGGGGGLSRRRRRRSTPRSYSDLEYVGAGNSEAKSDSSDSDMIVFGSRDKALDDALFGFFSKQAVKSLKRNFSEFCKDFSPSIEVKKNKVDGVDRACFSRYGLKYYQQVLKNLTPQQRAVITSLGFGCLLLFDLREIPSCFARWVADCVDPVCSQMTINGKPIDISKHTVHFVLGLPVGGLEVPCDSEDGRNFILSHFHLSEMPHITFFGTKLSGPEEISDHDVFISFMTVTISCFLCPELNASVNTKYLSVLKDPLSTQRHDFSNLVYSHFLNGINEFSSIGKLKGRRMKAPICCNYVPVVRYLDCLDFGVQNMDQTTPRVTVWRGNLIKVFSDLDKKSRHQYGKKQKKILLTTALRVVFA